MNLEAFCEETVARDLPRSTEKICPDRGVIKALSNAIQLCIQDRNFLFDCIAKEIDRLQISQIGRGLQAFHEIEPLGIRLAFGHWAPNASGLGPHTHTAWTVTSVCSNSLEVRTFDRDESCKQKTLVKKNQFTAIKGATGYIYEPSIHEPFNPTRNWTLSLHLVSPFDGDDDPNFDFDIPGLEHGLFNDWRQSVAHSRMLSTRIRFGAARNLLVNLSESNSKQARNLLVRLYEIAGSRDRKMICNYFQVPDIEVLDQQNTIYRPAHGAIKLSILQYAKRASLIIQIENEIISEREIAEAFVPVLRWIISNPVFDRREIFSIFNPGAVDVIIDYLEKWGVYYSERVAQRSALTDYIAAV